MFRDRPQTEIVLGARVKLLGRDVQRKLARHYLGRLFGTAEAAAIGREIYDSQCGAKLVRVTSTVHALSPKHFRSRWIFDVEILARFLELAGREI